MLNYLRKYLLRSINDPKDSAGAIPQFQVKLGKGKGRKAHTLTGIAKARRLARKIRNKQRSK
jgi:hypothetical protein